MFTPLSKKISLIEEKCFYFQLTKITVSNFNTITNTLTFSNFPKSKRGRGRDKSYLNKRINVQHQRLSPTDDKLIDTCNSMRPRNKI